MKVVVNDKVINQEFSNIGELDAFWKEFTRNLFEKDEVIQYIEINDNQIVQDFEQNIIQHFDSIRYLRVSTVSEQHLLLEAIGEAVSYISKMLDEIDSISTMFYGEIKGDEWRRFSHFTKGLEWIYMTLQSTEFLIKKHGIDGITDHEELLKVRDSFESRINELEEALNRKDFVTVGDLIEYEFRPLFLETTRLFANVRVN